MPLKKMTCLLRFQMPFIHDFNLTPLLGSLQAQPIGLSRKDRCDCYDCYRLAQLENLRDGYHIALSSCEWLYINIYCNVFTDRNLYFVECT